jgi:hypothetical protein
MPLIPYLILHQEAVILLCGERPDGDDEIAPLTGKIHIEMGSDDTSSLSSEDSCDSDSSPPSGTRSIDVDSDACVDQEGQALPLGATSPASDSSLFYANNEVHVFGKTVIAVENSAMGAQKVAKKMLQGIQKVPKETIKGTGKVAKKTAKETERAVKKTANIAASFPHELRADWGHLILLLVLHALGPVATSVLPTWLTVSIPVDAGLSYIRGFLYGTHTIIDLVLIAPFIATTHYAMPDAKIPLKAQIIAVLVGLASVKLTFACISEAWWHEKVFPIPFSFILSMVFSFSMYTVVHHSHAKRPGDWRQSPK